MAQLFSRINSSLVANVSIAIPAEQISEVASQEAADSPERRVIEELDIGRIGNRGLPGIVARSVGGKARFVPLW